MKAVALALVSVVLGLALHKQGEHFAVLLTLAACAMIAMVAVTYLEQVFSFFAKLQEIGNLNTDMMQILLKSVGIGLLAELSHLVCADAGKSALGKGIQILASAVVLWLSLPMLDSLLELVLEILGGV